MTPNDPRLPMEFVTDPVLWPGLRCPHCGAKVRVIRTGPTTGQQWKLAVAALAAWVVTGIARALGWAVQMTLALLWAALVLGPPAVVVGYAWGLRRSTFQCTRCLTQSTFAQLRRRSPGR